MITPRQNWKLSVQQSHDARRALELIGSRNLSLQECVKVALQLQSVDSISTPATTAVDNFLNAILRRGRRESTYDFYNERLKWFTQQHDGTLDDWDRPRLKRALESQLTNPAGQWSVATIKMTHRAIRALYGWAMQQNPPLARRNPCLGMRLDLPNVHRAIQFFTVTDVHAILSKIDAKLLPAALVLFFGGLRPEEVAPRNTKPRLLSEHVNLIEKHIRVPGDVAKVTGASRIIQGLPPTLWRLLPKKLPAGPICPVSADWLIWSMRGALGKKWIQDVTRHTFATYGMALEENAQKVSEWLGHEGEIGVFHRHYKGLVSRELALPYWNMELARKTV